MLPELRATLIVDIDNTNKRTQTRETAEMLETLTTRLSFIVMRNSASALNKQSHATGQYPADTQRTIMPRTLSIAAARRRMREFISALDAA